MKMKMKMKTERAEPTSPHPNHLSVLPRAVQLLQR